MTVHVEQWEYWHVPDVYDTVATCHACAWISTVGWHVPDMCQGTYHCRTCAILGGMCQSAGMCVLQGKADIGRHVLVPEVMVEVLCTCIVLQAAI